MRFYEVNLSDLRLTFPLPPHLASKRSHLLSFQWELTRTENLRAVGLFAVLGFIKLSLNETVEQVEQDILLLNSPKLVIILSKR